ncbi:MAG TPA: cytochrome c oxidase subunit 4 [Actinomycetota bacterium]
MRTEPRFLIGAGVFGATVGVVYWFLAYEDAGFAMLLFMGMASAFIGGYLLWKAGRATRPEDDPDADHAAAAGATVGRFSSGSIWPLVMGLGLMAGVQGFVFGVWLLLFGILLFVLSVVGLMLESRD